MTEGVSRRAPWLLPAARVAACAIVVVASLGVGIFWLPIPYDEGLIVSGARRILAGQVPYADFYTGYPPGEFYTVALVFRLCGAGLMSARIWDFFWRLALVIAAGWVAREMSGKLRGNLPRVLPLACCAAFVASQGFSLYPMIAATLPVLCALASALRFSRTGRLPWSFVAGILLGVTALYRHDLAACAALVLIVHLRRNLRAVVSLVAGALLAAGPVAVWLLVRVPGRFLREAFLEFPLVNAAARRLPITSAPPSILLLLAIVAFALYYAIRSATGDRGRLGVPAALAAASLLLATQRLDEVHAFPAFAVCMSILAGWRSGRVQRALFAVAACVYGALPLVTLAARCQTLRSLPPSGITRAGAVRIPPRQAEAVRYIDARVPAGEKIFVGTGSHSRVFINDALLSFLADRMQATRYEMWVPGVTTTAPVQSEMIRDLEANRVRFAVLVDFLPSAEPNASSVDSGVHLLDDYLNANFRTAWRAGPYRVAERVSP